MGGVVLYGMGFSSHQKRTLEKSFSCSFEKVLDFVPMRESGLSLGICEIMYAVVFLRVDIKISF